VTDILSSGLDWLENQRKEHMTTTVTYRRPGHPATNISASLGLTNFEAVDESGIRVESVRMDFLINESDLTLGGEQIDPEAGDEIDVTIGGQSRTYEVRKMAGEGEWRWVDPHSGLMRIHARRM